MASVIVDSNPDLEASSKAAKLQSRILSNGSREFFSLNNQDVENWYKSIKDTNGSAKYNLLQATTRLRHKKINPQETLSPAASSVSYFQMRQIASIYNISSSSTTPVTVGVVSFGGGLYGRMGTDGVMTGTDIQQYWTAIGIPTNSQPKVIVKTINGATNTPNINDGGSTIENTIDVETIGGAFASPNLTIILYIAPNSLNEFYNVFNYMYTTPVVANGVSYKPSIISCSWGAPEVYFGSQILTQVTNLLSTMSAAGINICAATGDNGSNDGVGGSGNYVDFPSSCPYVTAVGGTNLVCPNSVYDSSTVETAWSSGGGGVSTSFPKPGYQSALTVTGRSIPDIAAVADPNTGVLYIINGQYYVIGGTSVAAPIIASFLASINCRTFANLKFYTAPSSSFHDITFGSNGGFSARIGYDNCTGFGSINGLGLSGYLTSIQATSLSLSPTTLSLLTNSTGLLTPIVLPSNTSNTTLTWSSSDTTIVTVANGVLTTFATAGSATITATTTDDSNLTATAVVIVSYPGIPVPVTGVIVSPTSFISHATLTTQLQATVQPSNAANKAVIWTSNSANATVSSTGLVTGVTIGTATITVSTVDGNFTASSTVNVTQPVTSITLSNTSLSLKTSQTQQLTATVLPSSAPNKAVVWTSGNTTIATVSSTGLVTAVGNGVVNITATTSDMGLVAVCVVTIGTAVQSVSLNVSNISLLLNQTFQAVATVSPNTATNKAVTWSSSFPNVATVSSNGLITAVGNGQTIVRVITQDGGKTASILVTVTTPVTGVTLPATLRIARGSSVRLVPTIIPATASNKVVFWASNNGPVATVSSLGSVLGVRVGTAIISVRTADGNRVATCVVTVF